MLPLGLAMLAAGVASVSPAPAPSRPAATAYATCVAAKHPVEAKRFVLHQYNGSWQAPIADFRKLKDGACVSSQASKDDAKALRGISEDRLKIDLAQVLVRRDLAQFDASLITNARPLPSTEQVDALWKRPEDCKNCDAKQVADLANVRKVFTERLMPQIFSECAVRADPANVHHLLMTDRDSGVEQQAFGALAPVFSQCVAPDQKLSVTKASLRDILGYIYYRVAFAPRIATASAGVAK